MVRLKTVLLKGFSHKSKFDVSQEDQNPMTGKKGSKEKKLKSRSLIDVSIFKDKRKAKKKEAERLIASSWDVSAVPPTIRESWNDLGAVCEEEAPLRKGRLRRSSSVDNLSLYNRSNSSPLTSRGTTEYFTENEELTATGTSSCSTSQITCIHESSDDSLSTLPTSTTNIAKRRSVLHQLSQSTPSITPSASPIKKNSKEVHRSHFRKRTKKFLRRFPRVDSSEQVLNYYACALVADILLQGTLFITDNYFAFHSNIFGYVSKVLIPITQVIDIQKEKTAKFIPNAVRVTTEKTKTYVFSSLLSRDSTYRFMVWNWRKVKRLPDITDDDTSFIVPQEADEVFDEDSASISGDDSLLEEESLSITKTERRISLWSNAAAVIPKSYLNGVGLSSQSTTVAGSSSSEAPNTAKRYSSQSLLTDEAKVNGPNSLLRRQQSRPNINGERIQKSSNPDKQLKQTLLQEQIKPSSTGNLISPIQIPALTTVVGAPFRLVLRGISNVTSLCQQSIVSSVLVLLLLVSAVFILHRVEELSNHMNPSHFKQSDDLYEDVLNMQQRLHSTLAEEVEKVVKSQLKQLATVRQSLDTLVLLFNQQPSPSSILSPINTSKDKT